LAVRFESHPDVAKALPNWKGKTIIDVTNAYGVESCSWRATMTVPQRRLACGNSWGRLIFKDLVKFD
jgi:predicted dinucleotide-binding enzyme